MNPNVAMQGGDPMQGSMMSMHHQPGGPGSTQPQGPHPGGPPHGMGPMTRCCAGCGGKIFDRYLLHAMDRYWHNGCLKCTCCAALLAEIGSSCFAKGGMILCRKDYIRMFGMSGACSGCAQMIPAGEVVNRAQTNVYHLKCFACVKCHNQLVPGDRFHLVNGSLLCEQDCVKMLKGSVSPVQRGKTSKVRLNSAIKV